VAINSLLDQLQFSLADRYAVEREIGRGGMATVYLARDLRHQRHVALKVLDPELGISLGADRFLSEIRVTANLQHPNLLPLFDSGTADGLLFYVMPFIDGESLRARLDRERQLPIDDAVHIATAVASALDYAHRHGVIHRDLKPENILLHDGEPLVADFGIALAISKAGNVRLTQDGISLGTPQYMSPEQATGDRVIDGRADIYSLGAVTYEMLAGEPPHTASTVQGVVAKLMTEDPRPLTVLRRNVPRHVDAAVRRALEKLPADRYATGRAFADGLQGKGNSRISIGSAISARSRLVLAAACGATALTLLGAWMWSHAARAPELAPVRLKLDFPASERFEEAEGESVAISPDGRTIAYLAHSGQTPRSIFVRRLDALEARILPGTENARHPRFSRDGRWILYAGEGDRLNKIPVDGGSSSLVARLKRWEGHGWGANGAIVYSDSGEIWHLRAAGERPAKIAALEKGELDLSGPFVLPDGDHVLFGIGQSLAQSPGLKLGLVSIANPRRRTIDLVGASPLDYTDGWLIYGRPDETIAAIKFDPQTARTSGEPITLLDGVFWKLQGGVTAMLSASGSLIYLHGSSNSSLSTLDAHGSVLTTTGEPRSYWSPVWSPDGKRIAVEVRTVSTAVASAIWIYDVTSGVFSRMTSRVSAERPSWTADGKRIAFIEADQGTSSSVWSVPADGSGPEEQFYSLPGHPLREVTFSPDGNYAVFRAITGEAARAADLWLLPLHGERKAVPFGQTPFSAAQPAISPNSKWVAYESDATGIVDIYVRPLPGPGGILQVSASGGTEPRWLPDGRLVYRGGGAFRAATVSEVHGAPTVVRRDSLFADTYRTNDDRQNYDVSRDGQFVVARHESADGGIVVVVNWLTEVRARLRGK
jgi:serine/threonine-protein kinase